MKIVVHESSDISLRELAEPGFEIESEGEAHFSAMEMFAASIALCVLSVLHEYGHRFDAPIDDASARVKLIYVEDPFRVGEIELTVTWPALPEDRLRAAERAAAQCTIHHTLEHPPEIHTTVSIN